MAATNHNPLSFTVLTKHKDGNPAPISKTIKLVDGDIVSNADDCWLATGYAMRYEFADLGGFARAMSKLQPQHAICLGNPLVAGERSEARKGVPLTTVRNAAQGKAPEGAIARSKDNFAFADDLAGLLLVDHDDKAMTQAVKDQLAELGGIDGALHHIAPALADASQLTRASTSSAVVNDSTGQLIGSGKGCHKYYHVANQADIPRATKALHQRAWLHGLGWYMISKAGALLERSIVDMSVASPERIIYEAPPVLGEGLTYDDTMRVADVRKGMVLDTVEAVPSLTARERAEYKALRAAAKRAAQPEADRIRAEYITARAREIADRDKVNFNVALERLQLITEGRLTAELQLHFDDGDKATVADVLLNPPAYIGRTLGDPLEPDYGRCKAIIQSGDFGVPFIVSQAHGVQTTYMLAHNEGSLGRELDRLIGLKAENPDIGEISAVGIDRLAYLIALSSVEDTAETAIVDRIITNFPRRGLSMRNFEGYVTKHRRKMRADFRKNNDEDDATEDARANVTLLPGGGEISDTLMQIDATLVALDDRDPPVRNLSGHYMIEKYEEVRRLGGSDDGSMRTSSLTLASPLDVVVDLEKFMSFTQLTKTGHKPTSLTNRVGEAFAEWNESTLPRVAGIATLPMVVNGNVQKDNGLNRELQLVLNAPPHILSALPDPGDVTLKKAADAYKWLMDNMFVDVQATDAGMGAAVAMMAHVIQRYTLAEAPLYIVSAPTRGGGKTTLARMICVATTGDDAPATAWSDNPEERRKAIFSLLMKSRPFVVFDNIANGGTISDETVALAATSPTLSDRMLGASSEVTVSTASIMCFTGNNIGAHSDIASRSLGIHLQPDREDPENRPFVHADIIGWTRENRNKILHAVYTILLADPGEHGEASGGGGTRFVEWYQSIGRKVEAAAIVAGKPFTFRSLAEAAESDNEERSSLQVLFEVLREKAGDGPFTTADAAKWMTRPDKPFDTFGVSEDKMAIWENACADADELREALNEVAPGRQGSNIIGPNSVTNKRVGAKLKAVQDKIASITVGEQALSMQLTVAPESTARMTTWRIGEVSK